MKNIINYNNEIIQLNWFLIIIVTIIVFSISTLVYAQYEVELEITPKTVKYWDSVTIHAYLLSYNKPDEERYAIDIFDPDGKLIDSTLWFARQDHFSNISTQNLAYKISKIGEYRVAIEKTQNIERTGEIIITDSFFLTTYPPPLKQTKLGIPTDLIQCNDGLKKIFKSHDNSAICIKNASSTMLLNRGWKIYS